MVQKERPARGRPRSYDPKTALDRAMGAFWRAGFAATSLDDLTASTDMNRPSLYAAFGDKQALYLKTLDRYRVATREGLERIVRGDEPIASKVRAMYGAALDMYRAGKEGARGCYLIGTAAAAAVADPAVRSLLAESLVQLDEGLAVAFRDAAARGELDDGAAPDALAAIAMSVMHSMAVRARAGASRQALEDLAESAVALVCRGGGAPATRAGARGEAPAAAGAKTGRGSAKAWDANPKSEGPRVESRKNAGSKSANPKNASPTNASPTNASPKNANSKDASPTNASPTNASLKSTGPKSTGPKSVRRR